MENYMFKDEIEEVKQQFYENGYKIIKADKKMIKLFKKARPKIIRRFYEKGIAYKEGMTLNEIVKTIYHDIKMYGELDRKGRVYRITTSNGLYILTNNNKSDLDIPDVEFVFTMDLNFHRELDLKGYRTADDMSGGGGDFRFTGDLKGSICKAVTKRLDIRRYLQNELSQLKMKRGSLNHKISTIERQLNPNSN